MTTSNGGFSVNDSAFTVNTWIYYTVTYDGSTLMLYKNGVLIGSTAVTGTIASNTNVNIGALFTAGPFVSGGIQDLRLFNRALSGTEIAQMYAAETQLQGPVGWWKLNEGTGTVIRDSSGYGNNGAWNGTASGASGYYSAGHNQQWAGYFDGSTDFDFMGAPSVVSSTALTLSAWINLSSLNIQQDVLSRYTTSSSDMLEISSTNGIRVDFILSGGAANFTYTTPLTAGVWHHLVATYNGAIVALYVDGQLAQTLPGSGSFVNTQSWYMGQLGNGLRFFHGSIQDVRIYNRALSAAEVAQMYSAGN